MRTLFNYNILDSKENFFDLVLQTSKHIPFGRITTYGAIAKYIGSPQSSRVVGWVLNKSGNHKDFIPAHRVVNRNGLLTGKSHFGGSEIMRQLLESEGIHVIDDKIQNFNKHFWDPASELR